MTCPLAPNLFFLDEVPEQWAERSLASGAPDRSELVPYVYPPIWAALLAPLTTVTNAQVFFSVSQFIQIVALVAALLLAWRIAKDA